MNDCFFGGLPSAFKAKIIGEKPDIPRGTILKSVNWLEVEFDGYSRVDENPLFKVINGTRPLGDYFINGTLILSGSYILNGTTEEVNVNITVSNYSLVSVKFKNKLK